MNLKQISLIAALAVLALSMGGCGTGGGPAGGSGAAVDDRSGAYVDGAATQGARASGPWRGDTLDDPNSPLYTKVIYFGFDEDSIRQEYYPVLRAHADYLVNNRAVNLIVEGHTDESGSREYNIGLGERRALAVVRFLETQGVSPNQLSTLSYGEERPEDPGHYEAAWALNRRAVLNHQ